MPPRLPQEVHILLHSEQRADREVAWESFLASHSRLMLYVARSLTRDADETLDAYAWSIERLKEDDCHRLRGFSEASGTLFSTWLVVVVRRLCLDFLRHKRGRRPKDANNGPSEQNRIRRRLADLAGESIVLEHLQDTGSDAGSQLAVRELYGALEAAMKSLPAEDRLLLSLRFEDRLSAAEIARITNAPSQFHVYRRIKTVLGLLRQRLAEAGVDGPEP